MPNQQGMGGIFRLGECVMPDNLGSQTESVKRLATYPINLQSFLQTAILIFTLFAGVAYAERRLTQIEMKSQRTDEILQEQKQLIKEQNELIQRSLSNQDEMLKRISEASRRR